MEKQKSEIIFGLPSEIYWQTFLVFVAAYVGLFFLSDLQNISAFMAFCLSFGFMFGAIQKYRLRKITEPAVQSQNDS
ncbi:hypothetical protein [Deinococcus cellulosilyticus]|uniref:Uncharacterized protein n=1 Tax=Deinococcus cellulosilyticus (strain DSM 18568 / NBRC 106333 / KACC 11606 / 5516J-15) TaxID=1223518 RepID=A0A511NBA6_DEIC1|nr:hypothetical protein [Deinococcus cellulosilyticus]GEM50109.1 hypothetical protein DC3_57440 [Deinococcus cellulosilyticus NBRC 106333 = KACC 11606]